MIVLAEGLVMEVGFIAFFWESLLYVIIYTHVDKYKDIDIDLDGAGLY